MSLYHVYLLGEVFILTIGVLLHKCQCFTYPTSNWHCSNEKRYLSTTFLQSVSSPSSIHSAAGSRDSKALSTMKISEIRKSLEELNIDYSDCFDKESLVDRLRDAMEGKSNVSMEQNQKSNSSTKISPNEVSTKVAEKSGGNSISSPSVNSQNTSTFDESSMLQEIRNMKVREIREELASRQIRWSGYLEKEDLVRALFQARKDSLSFSVTGLIRPGLVADLTADEIKMELNSSSNVGKPLLLDVYATWCGPCKLMLEQLKLAATDDVFQNEVRLAKIDSDKYSEMASFLKIKGLPTLILFDSNGKEIDRVEGAMMKKQLIEWVKSKT